MSPSENCGPCPGGAGAAVLRHDFLCSFHPAFWHLFSGSRQRRELTATRTIASLAYKASAGCPRTEAMLYGLHENTHTHRPRVVRKAYFLGD